MDQHSKIFDGNCRRPITQLSLARSRPETCNTPEIPGGDRGADPSARIVTCQYDSPRFALVIMEPPSERFQSLDAGLLVAWPHCIFPPHLPRDTAMRWLLADLQADQDNNERMDHP